MAGFTTAYQAQVGNKIFRNVPLTASSATKYVGYSMSAGTENTDGNYVRQVITFGAFVATTGISTNSSAVTFPAAAAGHNVVECCLFTATTGGTQISDWKALTGGTVALTTGQQFRIPAASYQLTVE